MDKHVARAATQYRHGLLTYVHAQTIRFFAKLQDNIDYADTALN